jgi:uncharacterized protein (TIGR02270 family)
MNQQHTAAATTPGIVPNVLYQHAEDASILHATRTALITAPHVRLKHLGRFDDRLAAHLDGLLVAGDHAWLACAAQLERPRAGSVFTVAALALESGNNEQLTRMCALAEGVSELRSGLLAALGWTAPARLVGVVANLLSSSSPFHRLLGIAASAMHRVDPGLAGRHTRDPDPAVRARALRAAGELGLYQLVSSLAAAIDDEDPECRFWAAWSAVLLGDRERALQFLAQSARGAEDLSSELQGRAFQLSLQAMGVRAAHALLRQMAADPGNGRRKIQGAGLIGDPAYVPWLIGQMTEEATARLAGEAFSLITGADLASLDLERKPPDTIQAGPTDDPEDPNIDMDPDEGLPWPDSQRVQGWWDAHAANFSSGDRCFMGSAVTRESCIRVLRHGFQRQRRAAALHLSLSQSGSTLFEYRAPASRQRQQLADMA